MTLSEIDVDQLIRDVGSWSEDNFGAQPATYPLLGAVEELGELSTSVLKRAQGIDTSDKYDGRDDVGVEAERDALGDIVIYLADFAYRCDRIERHLEVNDIEGDVASNPRHRVEAVLDASNQLTSIVGSLAQTGATPPVEDSLEATLELLSVVADGLGYDLHDCVTDAWHGEVKTREWDAADD